MQMKKLHALAENKTKLKTTTNRPKVYQVITDTQSERETDSGTNKQMGAVEKRQQLGKWSFNK